MPQIRPFPARVGRPLLTPLVLFLLGVLAAACASADPPRSAAPPSASTADTVPTATPTPDGTTPGSAAVDPTGRAPRADARPSGSPVALPVRVGGPGEEVALSANLFAPAGADPGESRPTVVMGPGLGLLQTSGLAPFVAAFTDAGYRVVTFDYRGFGASEGAPRQVVDPQAQLDDWRAVIAATRAAPGVDRSRLSLWGTSFSGGHVLQLGAEDPSLAAVVSQVPHVDASASADAVEPGVASSLLEQALAPQAPGAPTMVPLIGPVGSVAVMSQPGSEEGYRRLVAADPAWRNEIDAAFVTRLVEYSPGRVATNSVVPTFVGVAERDVVTPAAPAVAVAEAMAGAELHRYDGGHFDVYEGAVFQQIVADEVAFLRRHLG